MSSEKNISPSVNHGGLTHFDDGGRAHMVDVGSKAETHRIAIASGLIRMKPQTLAVITSGTAKKKAMFLVSPALPPSLGPSAPLTSSRYVIRWH